MYPFVRIDKALAYVPPVLLEEYDDATLLKYAGLGYRSNVRNRFNKDIVLYAILCVEDYKASLPIDFKGVFDAFYTKDSPAMEDDSTTLFLQTDFYGNKVTVYQALAIQDVLPYATKMRYVGKDKDIVNNGCIRYTCSDCINFSISPSLSTVTLDEKTGYVNMLYFKENTDEFGNILIPDDDILLQAIGFFVEAMYYRDLSSRRDPHSEQMYERRLQRSVALFKEFEKRDLLRKLSVEQLDFNLRGQMQLLIERYKADRIS